METSPEPVETLNADDDSREIQKFNESIMAQEERKAPQISSLAINNEMIEGHAQTT